MNDNNVVITKMDNFEKQSSPSKKVDEMMSVLYNWSEHHEIEVINTTNKQEQQIINSEDEEELIVEKISKSG